MSTEQEKRLHDLQLKNQNASNYAFKINARIENAQERLNELMNIAQNKFQKSTLEELKAQRDQWAKENTENLDKFEAQINELGREVQSKYHLIKQIQQS